MYLVNVKVALYRFFFRKVKEQILENQENNAIRFKKCSLLPLHLGRLSECLLSNATISIATRFQKQHLPNHYDESTRGKRLIFVPDLILTYLGASSFTMVIYQLITIIKANCISLRLSPSIYGGAVGPKTSARISDF